MSKDGLKPLLNDPMIRVVFENLEETSIPHSEIDGIIVRSGTTIRRNHLETLTRLKIIGRAGVGVDNIDIEAATEKGIVVINAPNGNTISTAEHTFAMMISLLRNIPQANASMENGLWDRKRFQGTELNEKNLGIIGFGKIGAELAKRAAAFQMSIYVYDPFLPAEKAKDFHVTAVSLDELLKVSDIITVHTPLTKETDGLIAKEEFKKVKKGAYVINCARGGIICETSLYDAIVSGHVKGAALDVFKSEPVHDNPLTKLSEVITTPHIAASTIEAQENVALQVSEEIRHFFEGKQLRSSINLPITDHRHSDKTVSFYPFLETMGEMASQLMKEPVKEVEISFSGEVNLDETSLLQRRFLSGFFRSRIDQHVNDVNAIYIANERHIKISQSYDKDSKGFTNLVKAKVYGENNTLQLFGTFHSELGPRIIRLNHFSIDFQPQKHNLFIQHIDKPGVIGKVGQLLGEKNINIASMQVGRNKQGGEAVMLLSVDKECTFEQINSLTKVEDLKFALPIELSL